jgi:hypothetical protein
MVWIKRAVTQLNLSQKKLTLGQLKQICDELAVLLHLCTSVPDYSTSEFVDLHRPCAHSPSLIFAFVFRCAFSVSVVCCVSTHFISSTPL